MRTAGYVLGAVLAAALGACAHQNAQGPATSAQATPTAAGPSCPLAQLQGVHATVADIKDGVAITFTGPAGELDQLRDNVHAMGDANDKQGDPFAACPCARTAMGAAEAMPSTTPDQTATPQARPKLAADAKVDEIATGAVLKLTAKHDKDTNALRSAVREDVHALRKNCLNQSRGSAQPQGTSP